MWDVHFFYVVVKVSSKQSLKIQSLFFTDWIFKLRFCFEPLKKAYLYGYIQLFFCLKNQQWSGYYRRLLLIWLMYEFQRIKKTCLSRLTHPSYTNITDLPIKLLVSFFMSFCSQIRGIHLNFFGTIFRGPLSYLQAKLFYPEKEQKKIFPVMNLLIKMLREGGYFLLQGTCPCK